MNLCGIFLDFFFTDTLKLDIELQTIIITIAEIMPARICNVSLKELSIHIVEEMCCSSFQTDK